MATASGSQALAETTVDFGRLLDARAVSVVFQPLVDLRDGAVLGYEALARGPAGSPLERPDALFAAAYRAGRVPELDWACRAAAFRAVLESGLDASWSLFVNTEPVSLRTPCPDDLRSTVAAAEGRLRVVMEVTERAVAHDPAGLLAAVAGARGVGWGIALDDVGAEPASLAVMPFVNPDVIKLDLRLIQGRTTTEVASIVNAVAAHAERTGATILAEGIETPDHTETARALGATVGQGWLYGRPGALPSDRPAPRGTIKLLGRAYPTGGSTPFDVVTAHRVPARATKRLLLPMSRHLEYKGLDMTEPTVLLACFQEARHFTPATRRRFERLARHAAFTGALGVGMPPEPIPGIRGADLRGDDRLRGEWDVIAVGPHFAGALAARDLGDHGPDELRRFDVVITHDRELVVRAARALLAKLIPTDPAAAVDG